MADGYKVESGDAYLEMVAPPCRIRMHSEYGIALRESAKAGRLACFYDLKAHPTQSLHFDTRVLMLVIFIKFPFPYLRLKGKQGL